VRCWGLYAHTQGAALAVCRSQVGQGPVEAPAPPDGPHADDSWGEAHPERCPVCGQSLVCTALLPRAGVPPPAATGWEQVACGGEWTWSIGGGLSGDSCGLQQGERGLVRARSRHGGPDACRGECRPPRVQVLGASQGCDPRVEPASKLHSARDRHAALGARAVQPGDEADRGGLGGIPVDRSRGRLTLIR